MRVVVIGGYGNFGARVCRALSVSPAMEVVAAGRHPERGQGAFDGLKLQHVRLDHSEHDFPRALARLAPGLVIHCAWPFQSQYYRVALSALAAGAHYLDLDLFPKRYPGVLTMEFRASLEVGAQQFALWLAALLRRRGMALPIERWAKPLARIASWMDAFGGDLAGMLVNVTGRRPDGSRARIEWHLTADAQHGPEIPCMAAILLARKLAQGGVAQPGAYSCMGFLALPEFETEFARWRSTTAG